MSALTNSITHELSQPLSAMMNNTYALQVMVATNRATSETTREMLSTIHSQGVLAKQIVERQRTMLRGRELQKQPIDLHAVVRETLALLAHDIGTRQVEVIVNLSSTPCIVSGDPVLLQQVLVNVVINAMDAMAETPPARRRLTITKRSRRRRCRSFRERHWTRACRPIS